MSNVEKAQAELVEQLVEAESERDIQIIDQKLKVLGKLKAE